MAPSRWWLLAFAGLLACLPLAAKDKVRPADLVPVRLEGAAAFPAKEVLAAAGVKASLAQSLLRRPPRADRGDLEAAAEAVRLFYQREGYFEATVTAVVQDGSQGKKSGVLKVVEGLPCLVKTVRVELAAGVPEGEADASALGRDLPLSTGKRFSSDAYEEAQSLILSRLKEDGRAFAEVSPEAVVDLAVHEVDVIYTVTPGGRYTVGTVKFLGREKSEELVLRRALALAPGQVFRQSKVEESRENLYSLGLFGSVTFTLTPSSEQGTVDILVRLKEGKLHRVRLGVGYGTEDRLRAQVRWETLRFASKTMVVGAELKASAIDDRLEAYLRRPFAFDRKTTLLANLTFGKKVEQDFDYEYLKAQWGYQRDFLPGRLNGSAFLVAERVLQFTPNQSLDDALQGGARQVATMTSLAASLNYRNTDDLLNPSRGLLCNFYLEPTKVLDGGTFFTKAILEGRWYAGLRPGWTLGLKLKLGDIASADPEGVPLTRRFYAGGANSIRGYAYGSLGPLSPEGALVGGNGLVEASAELRFPLKGSLKGLVFVDAGNALPKAFEFPTGWLRAGAGLGVRFQTVVGPVGLDLAWRLKPDPLNPSPYQMYFFIGYAF